MAEQAEEKIRPGRIMAKRADDRVDRVIDALLNGREEAALAHAREAKAHTSSLYQDCKGRATITLEVY